MIAFCPINPFWWPVKADLHVNDVTYALEEQLETLWRGYYLACQWLNTRDRILLEDNLQGVRDTLDMVVGLDQDVDEEQARIEDLEIDLNKAYSRASEQQNELKLEAIEMMEAVATDVKDLVQDRIDNWDTIF